MNSRKSVCSMLWVLVVCAMAVAQVPSRIAIQSGNGGSVIAPTDPNGFLNIGSYAWISDSKGIFSFLTNPGNPSPLETGIYDFNLNSNWSIDNNVCLPFCSVGQVINVNDTMVFLAAWDQIWGIVFGGGTGINGQTNQLFFAAGPNNNNDGLFGMIEFKGN